MIKRVTLIRHTPECVHACAHIYSHQNTYKLVGVYLHSTTLCFIMDPFPPPNTQTGAGDKESTHSTLYTTSHLSRGNWKEEQKGGGHREVSRTADEG